MLLSRGWKFYKYVGSGKILNIELINKSHQIDIFTSEKEIPNDIIYETAIFSIEDNYSIQKIFLDGNSVLIFKKLNINLNNNNLSFEKYFYNLLKGFYKY